jgi:hypothetical protein
MNYYLVIIQNDETCAVYKYASYDEALAALHSEMAYRGNGRTETLCIIIKSDSSIPKMEYWKAQEEN